MRYDELTRKITGSSPDDWAVLPNGPLYLDRFGGFASGEQHWLETDAHYYLAIYKPDADVRLAWGLQIGDEMTYDEWAFPDRSVTRMLVDGFWRGALAARWTILSVDGGRCWLPDAEQTYVKTGDSALGDLEPTGWKAKASETALARMLNEINHPIGRDFDSYLQQTGVAIIPDEAW